MWLAPYSDLIYWFLAWILWLILLSIEGLCNRLLSSSSLHALPSSHLLLLSARIDRFTHCASTDTSSSVLLLGGEGLLICSRSYSFIYHVFTILLFDINQGLSLFRFIVTIILDIEHFPHLWESFDHLIHLVTEISTCLN